MVDHPEWASSRDPRHLADIYNERTNSLKPVSNSFNAFYYSLPEKVREKVLVNRRIQKIHQQFSQVVDPYILDHTNSVYLLRHKDPLGQSDKNGKEKNTYLDQNSTDSLSSTTVSNSGIYSLHSFPTRRSSDLIAEYITLIRKCSAIPISHFPISLLMKFKRYLIL